MNFCASVKKLWLSLNVYATIELKPDKALISVKAHDVNCY